MRKIPSNFVVVVLLVCLVGCNASFVPSFKNSISDSAMMPAVSKVIDSQLEIVKPYLEEDLQDMIDGGLSKGGEPLNGSEIVELTANETGGMDYLDFCYAVSGRADLEAVLETASYILPEEEFSDLVSKVNEAEKSILSEWEERSKAVPASQQEEFYKDLKRLVTRSLVLLSAGIVYACCPTIVIWGKVSAAAAVSVAAGMVALTIMSIYEYFKFDQGAGGFDQWLKEVASVPKADYALTASVMAIGTSLNRGPVVTGIILIVFAIYQVADMVRPMLKKYNFG